MGGHNHRGLWYIWGCFLGEVGLKLGYGLWGGFHELEGGGRPGRGTVMSKGAGTRMHKNVFPAIPYGPMSPTQKTLFLF